MTERYQLYEGDCLEVMRSFAPNTFDTLITDPPSGINFMGKTWDNHSRYIARTDKGQQTLDALTLLQLEPWAAGFVAFTVDWAVEALRCLKPGAMGLVWALPRTSDLTGLGLRLAGFEVRDNLYHLFGSGFPKGHRAGEAVRRSLGEGAYCECDANRHSSASTYPSQHKDAHTRNLGLSFDDDPQQPNAQHSSHTPLDYQGDYQPDSDSCDALAHQVQADDLAFPQQQGCAQEHNHSGVPWGDQGGESSHSPCQAQYNGHLSNRDSAHPLTYANGESFDTPQNKSGLANNSIQTDNEAQGFHKQYNSLQPLPYDMPPDQNYNTGLPCCQKCGKPIAHIWDGYNVALKPAVEEWLLIMKPLESTYAVNALQHGVAGLNIDGCRIETTQEEKDLMLSRRGVWSEERIGKNSTRFGKLGQESAMPHPAGRWPANLILDQQAAALLDEQSGETKSSGNRRGEIVNSPARSWSNTSTKGIAHIDYNDQGGSSRYFTVLPDEVRFCYTAKSSTAERNEGLDDLPEREGLGQQVAGAGGTAAIGNHNPTCDLCGCRKYGEPNKLSCNCDAPQWRAPRNNPTRNHHPTVKSLELMRWLVRLTKTPTGGHVLDPFAGSGTTGVACLLEGRECTLIEREAEYFNILKHRMEHWREEADVTPRKIKGSERDYSEMPIFQSLENDQIEKHPGDRDLL